MRKIYFEYTLLFILLPISLCFSYPISLKISGISISFLYIVYILIKNKYPFFKRGVQNYSKSIGIQIILNLSLLIVSTTLHLWLTNKSTLFNVVREKPLMWLSFLCIYSFLSVIPQEIIYRSFYFYRYKQLFNNTTVFLFSNALIFSIAHLFFQNILVSGITFIGGLIFAYSYNKTKSLVLVSIEHAIYGCWLYTVGFGAALGFPIP